MLVIGGMTVSFLSAVGGSTGFQSRLLSGRQSSYRRGNCHLGAVGMQAGVWCVSHSTQTQYRCGLPPVFTLLMLRGAETLTQLSHHSTAGQKSRSQLDFGVKSVDTNLPCDPRSGFATLGS